MSETLPFLFAVYPLLLSGVAFYWLLGSRHRNRSDWAMRVLASGSIVTFAFLAGTWAFTSYYLRYVVLALFPVVAGYAYRRMKDHVSSAPKHDAGGSVFSAAIFVLFAGLNGLAVASHYHFGKSLSLSFPLDSGTYYVLQGGTSVVTNPFHALAGGKLAVDIVKLNSFGSRADGIAPRALPAYEIFGERLRSPCEGSVLRIRDGLPDNAPGNPDAEYPEGNFIVLKCAEVEVLMGHLKRGSIQVAQGATVTVGQPLADIGNSGNSLEPHLHIAAKKDSLEIGLMFDGRLLSINGVVTRR